HEPVTRGVVRAVRQVLQGAVDDLAHYLAGLAVDVRPAINPGPGRIIVQVNARCVLVGGEPARQIVHPCVRQVRQVLDAGHEWCVVTYPAEVDPFLLISPDSTLAINTTMSAESARRQPAVNLSEPTIHAGPDHRVPVPPAHDFDVRTGLVVPVQELR